MAPRRKGIPQLTAREAAILIGHGCLVGFSGFTRAGSAKAIPAAMARRAREMHAAGHAFQIGVITGASAGPSLDASLARAEAIAFRTPYQSDPTLRRDINAGHVRYFDLNLSTVAPALRYGFFGPLDFAVVEACEVRPSGELVFTTSVGNSVTFCRQARHVLVELNRRHSPRLHGLHDLYEPADPPHRREIPLYQTDDRIGRPTLAVDPAKILGIVETSLEDEGGSFPPPNPITRAIGQNVARFLAAERAAGRLPATFLPVQSGVGNTANAVLQALGQEAGIPPFPMFTEVIQDAAVDLLRAGRVTLASGTALCLSPAARQEFHRDLDFFRTRVVLRPQEITNHPELIRRLGVISINTALEADVFGNVNSTHLLGREVVNGIGGSADFTNNAYLSIFTCPSTARGGTISTIVPLVSHVDHTEHCVQVLVTEHGVADLRGKDPHERARLVTDRCAHPDFRTELHGYFDSARWGHTPQTLASAFAMHEQYLRTGNMRGVDWAPRLAVEM